LQKQITDGEFDENGPQWSPDGNTIYFTSTRVPEPYVDELGDEIYAVAASGGAIRKVAAIEGSIGNLSVSPDGKRIAFVGTERAHVREQSVVEVAQRRLAALLFVPVVAQLQQHQLPC